jgi:mono/diheme cytochrome c family protein
MGDGPTVPELPGPPTLFADPMSVFERSPAQLFYTTKFGIAEALMPPWRNRMDDTQIWQSVAYAWSLHTAQPAVESGQALYAQECAACHGEGGAGDGPEASEEINDFTDLAYAINRSQADWLAGWQDAHPDAGGAWSLEDQTNVLEYVRTFSLAPPWESPYQPGNGVIRGTVVQRTAGGPQPVGQPISLEAFAGFEPVASFTSTVGVSNTFEFSGLATDPALAYIATTSSEDVRFSSDFLVLSPVTPTLETELSVYGTTDDPAALVIDRMHWIVDSQPGALLIAQIYSFGNTSDRAFTGQTVEGVEQPVTAAIVLPPGAVEVTMDSGTIGDRFQQVGDVIYDTLPVVPGAETRRIIVQYALPYDGTSVDLNLEYLYPVRDANMLVADLPGLKVDATGMVFDSTADMQGQVFQIWRQQEMELGAVSVSLEGLLEQGMVDPRALQGTDAAGSTDSTGSVAGSGALQQADPVMEPWMAGVLAGVVGAGLALMVIVAMRQGAMRSKPNRQDMAATRDDLLEQIAEVDDRHALGELDDGQWLQQRSELKAQLVEVSARLGRGKRQ